ncbi:hypothetical protein SAMN05421829_102333 [Aromatoleum tolulyticum]|uniref:Uncharacterized protein n=1 Tax=Aromatoleum tolulyticum TaxID=34027 RepID=A0A1N6Q481_9RHOO|nr:hypothetical protein [Aromatoleum tolulyticum]SIQ11269.1 hypothetical protein SAMN05421829_102333 [Aromatoleum tolulyticum]
MITDAFISELNLANYLASRQSGQPPTYLARPTLSGELMTFYCPACRRPHWHGRMTGISHYVAHCADSRAHPAGYYVGLVPEDSAAPARPARVTPVGSVYPKYPAMTV